MISLYHIDEETEPQEGSESWAKAAAGEHQNQD
jgi:hypothetical protein